MVNTTGDTMCARSLSNTACARGLACRNCRDHPWSGWEFDWLGIDRYGHVAVFSNAGCGPLPETVNERLADVDAALDRADELPVIGSAVSDKNPEGGNYSLWYSYSAKGFYAYDWRRNWSRPARWWSGRLQPRASRRSPAGSSPRPRPPCSS
jgi:hypothetical protein